MAVTVGSMFAIAPWRLRASPLSSNRCSNA